MKPHTITIYGPGCRNCTILAENAQQAVQGLCGCFEIRKVTDPMELAHAGVFQTPALSMDGKMLLRGRVMSAEQLQELLREAISEESTCCCSPSAPINSCEADADLRAHSESCCRRGGWKTALLIGGIGVLAVAGLKQLQRSERQTPDASVGTPLQEASTELLYFTFGRRCSTCVRMEAWARDVAGQMQAPFRVQEADERMVQHYGLTGKTLVLRTLEAGKETSWRKLDQIWTLCRDEQTYKQYVTNELSKSIRP